MKIAQVCPYDFSRPGGVKTHIISLSRHLTKLGHEVKIIAPNINQVQEQGLDISYFGKNRSLSIWGTQIDLNLASGAELRDLKSFLKREQFDIIHFHTIWNPILPFQILANSKSKTVATFHDTPKNSFIGKLVMPIAAKLVFSFLNQVISVSKSQSNYITKFSSKSVSIIPNGIDLSVKFSNDIEKRENTLLFLSRLEPRKGVLHALKVFKNLQPNFPELTLKIAGDGEDRAKAEQYIRNHDLKKVEFLGFVSESEKIKLLQSSRVLVAPSLYGESFGIILLEAMANGLPISGYGNEGYLNALTGNQKKYFPTPGNVTALTSALEDLLLDENLRDKLAKEGLDQVKQFDWSIIAADIEQVYAEALKNS